MRLPASSALAALALLLLLGLAYPAQAGQEDFVSRTMGWLFFFLVALVGGAHLIEFNARLGVGLMLSSPFLPNFFVFGDWTMLFIALSSITGWVMTRIGYLAFATPSKSALYAALRLAGGAMVMVSYSYLVFVSELVSQLQNLAVYAQALYTLAGIAALGLAASSLVKDLRTQRLMREVKAPKQTHRRPRIDRAPARPAATQPVRARQPIDVIVDGSNVLLHGSKEGEPRPDLSNLAAVLSALRREGLSFHVILDAAERHRLARQPIGEAEASLLGELAGSRLEPGQSAAEAVEALVSAGLASYAPAGTDADHFIIRFAYGLGAMILSNDIFREYRDRYQHIDERRISFATLAGHVEFSPSLEDVRERLPLLRRGTGRQRPGYIG